jgi:hypothetical protein
MLISEWKVSARTRTCLINAGYKEVEEIRDLRDEDILAIKNLNELCLSEIKLALSKLECKNSNNRPDMMELFGNNLVGQIAGASNESIEIALEKLRSNPQEQAYRWEVLEAIRLRLSQGAHILIPGTASGNQQFIYGTWENNFDHTAWFIGFTSRKMREEGAGKDILQMPFKGFLESLLRTDGIEGVILNPGKDGAYLMDRSTIKNLLAEMDDTLRDENNLKNVVTTESLNVGGKTIKEWLIEYDFELPISLVDINEDENIYYVLRTIKANCVYAEMFQDGKSVDYCRFNIDSTKLYDVKGGL